MVEPQQKHKGLKRLYQVSWEQTWLNRSKARRADKIITGNQTDYQLNPEGVK
jgi:hypothetical protein